MKRFKEDSNGKTKYKFLSFTERIAAVNVDIFRNRSKYNELPLEDYETHFNRELHAWSFRTSEDEFRVVFNALRPLCMSLPMILHNLNNIIDILLENFALPSTKAAPAILSLIGILARDMRSQFYEHFPRVISSLVSKLDEWRLEPELLETLFETISYLFKYLQKYLTNDIALVLEYYVQFLIHPKPYIREFAVESFAFLIRRLTKPELEAFMPTLEKLLESHDYSEDICHALGNLFFFALKGVKGHYNSNLTDFLPVFLSIIQPASVTERRDRPLEARAMVLTILLKRLRQHGKSADNANVWSALENRLSLAIEGSASLLHEDQMVVYHMTNLMTEWARYRYRSSNVTPESLACTLQYLRSTNTKLLQSPLLSSEKAEHDVVSSAMHYLKCLVELVDHIESNYIDLPGDANLSLEEYFKLAFECKDEEAVVEFALGLVSYSKFANTVLPHLLRFLDNKITSAASHEQIVATVDVFRRLAEVAKLKGMVGINVDGESGRVIPFTNKVPEAIADQLTRNLNSNLEDDRALLALWSALTAVNMIKPNGSVLSKLSKALSSVVAKLSAVSDLTPSKSLILREALKSKMSWDIAFRQPLDISLLKIALDLLTNHSSNILIVQGVAGYLAQLVTLMEKQKYDIEKELTNALQIVEGLLFNLWHKEHHLRSATLSVIHSLATLAPQKDSVTARIAAECHAIEVSELNPLEWRNQATKMLRVCELAQSTNASNLDLKLAIVYLFGVFRLKLNLLWRPAREHLTTIASKNMKIYWSLLWKLFTETQKELSTPSTKSQNNDDDMEVEDGTDAEQNRHLAEAFRSALNVSHPSTDLVTFNGQLWSCIEAIHSSTQESSRQVRDVIESFIAYIKANYPHLTAGDNSDDEAGSSKRQIAAIQSLQNYLKFFSLFKNPKQFYQADKLFKIFSRLLSFYNEEVQAKALECLLQWKLDYLMPYKEHLQNLISEKTLRDELSGWSLRTEITDVLPQHRPLLIPHIIDILFPKLMHKGRSSTHNHRQAILAFLGSFQPEELGHLFDTLLLPFSGILQGANEQKDALQPESLSIRAGWKTQIKFLKLLEFFVRQLGFVLTPHLRPLLIVLLTLLSNAMQTKTKTDIPEEEMRFVRESASNVRRLGFFRLAEIMKIFTEYDYDYFRNVILYVIDNETLLFHQRLHEKSAGGIMQLVLVLTEHASLASFVEPVLGRLLACLKQPVISPGIRNDLYSLVENLLVLRDGDDEMETDEEPEPRIDLIANHVDTLLDALQQRLSSDYRAVKGRVALRELSLLERLTIYATNPQKADQLVSMLLPFLRNSKLPNASRTQIVLIFRNLIPLMTNPMKYLPQIARLFLEFSDRSSRDALCQTVQQFATVDQSLQPFVQILYDLNSYLPMRIDEMDYDRRFSAFTKVNEELISSLTEYQALLVMSNYFYFLECEDLSIRNNAAYGLKLLIKQVAQSQNTTPGALRASLLTGFILPNIKRHLDSSSFFARQEAAALLSTSLQSAPNLLPDLVPLTSEDEDNDFFFNIHHLQIHRRQRAVTKFTELCRQQMFKSPSLVAYVVPLLRHTILESNPKQHNLVEECVKAFAAIASQLEWSPYYRLLTSFIKEIPARPQLEHQLVKLICAILDEFHFDVSIDFDDVVEKMKQIAQREDEERRRQEEIQRAKEAEEGIESEQTAPQPDDVAAPEVVAEKPQTAEEKEERPEANNEENEEEDEEAAEEVVEEPKHTLTSAEAKQRQIQTQIVTVVLPKLYTYLRDNKGNVVRVGVAIAITKLLKLLPKSINEFQIARLITRVCAELASRLQSVRDSVREALKAMLASLGTYYLTFTLEQMRTILTRGYQLHVLSFTTHTLLHSIDNTPDHGYVDDALPVLFRILYEDYFGAPDEQKSEKKISNSMKETKSRTALDSFRLMAKLINFKESAHALMTPIVKALEASDDVTMVAKMQDILEQVAVGIRDNPSVDVPSALIFLHRFIVENLDTMQQEKAEEEAKKLKQKKFLDPNRKFLVEADPRKQRKVLDAASTPTEGSKHLLVVFALNVLYPLLKNGTIDAKDIQHMQMLDPFVLLIFRCIGSKFDIVLTNGMKCACKLLKYPLPSIANKAPRIARRTVLIMKKANIRGDLMQMCFKVLAHIIREVKNYEVPNDMLDVILNFVHISIEDTENPNVTFSLLKAIVWRTILHPAVYDIVPKLQKIMMQTSSTAIRQHCESVITQFLLTYPLSDKRTQAQLDAIVANLNYEFQPGRLALLNLLSTIFQRFPMEVLNSRADYFFVPLVHQMVNDDHPECREKAGQTIATLLKNIDEENRSKLLGVSLKWFNIQKPSMARVAAQLIALFASLLSDADKNAKSKFVKRVYPMVKTSILELSQDEENAEEQGIDDEYASVKWRLVYACLHALEKLVGLQPSIMMKQSFSPLWPAVKIFLLHPHSWVRTVSSRLFGIYFAFRNEHSPISAALRADASNASKDESEEEDEQTAETHDYLIGHRNLFELAKTFCRQLESSYLTPDHGKQIVKNLLFAGLNIKRFPQLTPRVVHDSSGEQQVESDEQHVEEEEEEHDQDEEQEQGQGQEQEQRKGLEPLAWLFRRLSYMARRVEPVAKTCIFQWIAAMTVQLTPEEVTPYLVPMLNPLYRTQQGTTEKSPDQLALVELATEVLELIQKRVGTPAFLAAYEAVRKSVQQKRLERKAELAALAVRDPQKAAERKLKRQQKKRERKKRKIREYSIVKNKIKVRKIHETEDM